MIRFVEVCTVLVVIAFVAAIPRNSIVEPIVILNLNSDISEFEHQSGLQELFSSSQLKAIAPTEAETTFRYTIGKRVLNDRILSQNKDSYEWDMPQNVTLILQYPSSGQGAIVTYIEVVANQSSRTGRASVLTGGIGQPFIVIIVEANNTYWFSYSSTIYGI